MSSIEYLLSLDPLQALVRMVNDANGTTFRLDRFRAGTPTVVGGTTTKVTLSGITETVTVDDQSTVGSFELTYERLEMGTFLKDTLADYHPYLPLSVQNILNEITELIGQKFYIDDMVLEEITRDTAALYRLKAKPESLRFVGFIDLPLIALSPIDGFFNTQAIALDDDPQAVRFSPNASLPFVNATDYRQMAGSFVMGDLAQDRSELVTLFNAVVPDPLDPHNTTDAPWYVGPVPGPFNLTNAQVIGYGKGQGINPAVPGLNKALLVQLDSAFTTNFAQGTVVLPYLDADFNLSGYSDKPRVILNSVVSLSDGTAWNLYLNSLVVGQLIDTFQAVPPVKMLGSQAWVAVDGLPSPTNLLGGTVLYNGQVPSTTIPAATQGLDRVLTIQMSDQNTIYQGPVDFFYSSPIKLILPDFLSSTVGSQYYYRFAPIRGAAPFAFNITEGALPAGLALDSVTGELTGTPTTKESPVYALTVTDANNVAVVFRITHKVGVAIADLKISGQLPDALVGEEYSYFLDISGGLAPYTAPNMVSGNAPSTILLDVLHTAIWVHGTWGVADTYYLAIGVTSADGQTTSKSFKVTVN